MIIYGQKTQKHKKQIAVKQLAKQNVIGINFSVYAISSSDF